MKKIVLILMSMLLINCSTNAQKKVQLVDVKNTEIAILVNVDENANFNEFYLFQYENIDVSEIVNAKSIYLLEANSDFIKLNCDDKYYYLTLDKDKIDSNEKFHVGYGLAFHQGKFTLKPTDNPITLHDYLLFNGERVTSSPGGCDSGGVGSSECSTDGGVVGGGANCSVKCNRGYYSCCNDMRNECRCKAEPKKITKAN